MRYAPGGQYEPNAADVERARQYDNEFGAGRWAYSKAPGAATPANPGNQMDGSMGNPPGTKGYGSGFDPLYGYGTVEAWRAAGSPKGGAKPSGGFDMGAYRPGQANPIPPQSQGTQYGQPVSQTGTVVPGQVYNPPNGGFAPVAAPKKPPFSMGPAQTPWGPSMDPLAERAKMIQLMEEENMRNQVQFNQTWTGDTPPPAEWMNARPTMTNIRDLIQQAGLGNGSPTMDPGYTGNTFVGDINQQFSGVPQQTGGYAIPNQRPAGKVELLDVLPDKNLAGSSPWGPPRPGMVYYDDSGWGWPNGNPPPQPNQTPPATSPQPYQFPPPYVPNGPDPFPPRPNRERQQIPTDEQRRGWAMQQDTQRQENILKGQADKRQREAEDRRNGVSQAANGVRVDRRGYPLDSPSGGMWVGSSWIPNGPPATAPAKPQKPKRRIR